MYAAAIVQVACGNYLAGDEVCIWGENDAELVEHFATQLGITAQQLDIAFLLQSIQVRQQWSQPPASINTSHK